MSSIETIIFSRSYILIFFFQSEKLTHCAINSRMCLWKIRWYAKETPSWSCCHFLCTHVLRRFFSSCLCMNAYANHQSQFCIQTFTGRFAWDKASSAFLNFVQSSYHYKISTDFDRSFKVLRSYLISCAINGMTAL